MIEIIPNFCWRIVSLDAFLLGALSHRQLAFNSFLDICLDYLTKSQTWFSEPQKQMTIIFPNNRISTTFAFKLYFLH